MLTVASSNTSGRRLLRTGALLAATVGLLLGLLVAVSPADAVGISSTTAEPADGAANGLAATATIGGTAAEDGNTPTAIQSGDADAAAVAYINAQNTGTVTQVSAGGYHSCAVTTGKTVYCWGDNRFGQLGNGQGGTSDDKSLVPVRVCAAGVADTDGKCGNQFLSGVVQVSTGDFHSCAVTDTGTGGTAYCWGNNSFGQLGNGQGGTSDDKSLRPESVVAGDQPDGDVLSGVVQVSAGGYHTCAVTDTGTGGTVYCWGWNGSGQLGNDQGGTPNDKSLRPESVVAGEQSDGDVLSGVVQVSAGGYHTCAVRDTGTGGTVFCWGRNDEGQLGNNSTGADPCEGLDGKPTGCSLVPVRVCAAGVADTAGKCGNQFLSGVVQVSTGDFHSCAVTDTGTGGTVYCWGSNHYGQLGNDQGGTSNDKSLVPVRVCAAGVADTAGKCGNQFLSGVVQVSAGGYHTCAVRDTGTGGTVFCWGKNDEGQLGIGSSDGPDECELSCSKVPVRVVNNEAQGFQNGQVSGLSAGRYHSCAVTEAGVAYCWGLNGSGRLGDGSTDRNSFVPVAVAGQLRVVPSPLVFDKTKVGDQDKQKFEVFSTFLEDVVVDATVTQVLGKNDPSEAFLQPALCGVAAKVVALVPADTGNCEGVAVFRPEQHGSYGAVLELKPYPNVGDDKEPEPGTGPLAAGSVSLAMGGYAEPDGPDNPDNPDENVGPVVLAEPNPVMFGTVAVGDVKTKKFTITNDGDEPLKIKKVRVQDDDDEFDVVATGQCLDGKIQPEKSCVVKVRFFPREDGSAAGLVKIVSNSDGSPNSVGLSGTGELVIVPDADGDLVPPGKVRKLKAASKSLSCRAATVSWQKPKDSGSAPVTSYDVRIKKNGEWKKWKSTDWVPNANNKITKRFKKLTPKTTYKVQVRAVSQAGAGEKKTVKFTTPRCGVPTKPGNG